MSEDDYIAATNLAKARIAWNVLRDVIPAKHVSEEELRALQRVMWQWIVLLEAAVHE